MTPHLSPRVFDTAFIFTVAGSFIALCTSVLFRTIGLWALRAALIALAAIYVFSTYQILSLNVQMAHAFNGSDTTGDFVIYVYYSFLVAYYGFAVATCFFKLPDARWFVPIVAVTTPIVALWQHTGMFLSAYLAYRALHAFCFVLVWFRIYDLRRQKNA